MEKINITVIVGATASGKTKFAIDLAKKTNSEIINADSRQIYKEISIGTAKPKFDISVKNEILVENIVHYGFDIASIKDDFNVSKFVDYFNGCIEKILYKKDKNIILCGGTGLYISACIFGLSSIPDIPKETRDFVNNFILEKGKEEALKLLREKDKITIIDENNPRRISRALEVVLHTNKPLAIWHKKDKKNEITNRFNVKIIGLDVERNELYNRIEKRIDLMIKDGMLEEAKLLNNMVLTEKEIINAGIGYKNLIDYLNGEIDLEKAIDLMKQETRNYAKRQITWFRKYENVEWIKK